VKKHHPLDFEKNELFGDLGFCEKKPSLGF
jgi:hypothetical protein